MTASLDSDLVFPPSQEQSLPSFSAANYRTEAIASSPPIDVQDHSIPHMKTRLTVRDRSPHRFQLIPLKDARDTFAPPPHNKATSLSNARKGLKDVTNSQATTPYGSLVVAETLDIKREHVIHTLGQIAQTQPAFLAIKALEHRAFKSETPTVFSMPQLKLSTVDSKFLPLRIPFRSLPVRPLNIVKRSPHGDDGSHPSLSGIRPTAIQPSIIQNESKPHTTNSAAPSRIIATATASTLPTSEFLKSPAEAALTLSKYCRRSRSSNAVFTSKLPTSSAHARMDSGCSEFPDGSNAKSSTSVSNLTNPTICQLSATYPTTMTLSSPHSAMKDATTCKNLKRVTGDIQTANKFINRRCSSKYLDSMSVTGYPQNTPESRIPFARLKASFHRTLDFAPLKPRHTTAHSVDIVSLDPHLLPQSLRTSKCQDVRNVFSNCGDLPKVVPRKTDKGSGSSQVTSSSQPRPRSTLKAEIPYKRHAIYTRSLYIGKAERNSTDCLRILGGTASPSLSSALNHAHAPTDHGDVPSAPSDSLESILQVYQDTSNYNGLHSKLSSMELPTSRSEPTLHDISNEPLAAASTINSPYDENESKSAKTLASSSSLPSVYSQDSLISGERQKVQASNVNDHMVIVDEQKISQDIGYHPIVWDLLEKLEFAQRTWLWDAGLDMF